MITPTESYSSERSNFARDCGQYVSAMCGHLTNAEMKYMIDVLRAGDSTRLLEYTKNNGSTCVRYSPNYSNSFLYKLRNGASMFHHFRHTVLIPTAIREDFRAIHDAIREDEDN